VNWKKSNDLIGEENRDRDKEKTNELTKGKRYSAVHGYFSIKEGSNPPDLSFLLHDYLL
jgi:hypothetical protein